MSPSVRTSCIALAAASIGLLPVSATAAIFCATTSTQLQAALDIASDNSQGDEVRVATGDYVVPADGPFRYLPGALDDDEDIVITGGWTAVGGNPCGQQPATISPLETRLDGHDLHHVMIVRVRPNTNAIIERLTFANGAPSATFGAHHVGLWIVAQSPVDNLVRIDRCAFIGNRGDIDSALYVGNVIRAYVQNSLFTLNESVTGPTLTMEGVGPSADTAQFFYFINNTVYANTVTAGDTAGARFGTLAEGRGFVANNLFWRNIGYDVKVSPGAHLVYRNNDAEDKDGTAPVELDNISVEPEFVGTLLDFTPAEGSVLADAGYNRPAATPSPPPFDYQWSEGTHDFRGGARRLHGRVDIGAFESPPPLFRDGFEDP